MGLAEEVESGGVELIGGVWASEEAIDGGAVGSLGENPGLLGASPQ
ncbi:hypothetical protein ACFQY7_17625 [Actinomadura luteofluorescens]